MRFPEARIKETILHPDLEVRDRAASYFASSSAPNPAIMPLVIKAVEAYDKKDAYQLIGLARDLPQSEDTLAWVLKELNDPRTDQYENYAYNLSMVLLEADPALLLPRESAILAARHFLPALREPFSERLRILSWDEATCWRRLEEFCEEGKDKQYITDVNLGYARCIVEALARHGKDCEERVRHLLSQKVEDFHNNPMKWMEPLAVRLAGQARLDALIPLVVAKLHEDADLLDEECAAALTRIGTPAVLEALSEAFPGAQHHFRLYAAGPLENIHSDLAVEKCLHLLGQEKEDSIRLNLAEALLGQLAYEGIEAARQLLRGRQLSFQSRGLRRYLLETCALMGERFPEYDEWLAADRADHEEHRRRVNELQGDPRGLLQFAMEQLAGKKAADVLGARPASPPAPRLPLPRKPEPKKVGRNDPCPCGSGKKFKSCCLRK